MERRRHVVSANMAGILVSPRFDVRVRKRNALYRRLHESPDFRDILRERCHARIKAKRGALIDQFRNIDKKTELHVSLCEILHSELDNFNRDASVNEPMEILPNVASTANTSEEVTDLWLFEEYEKVLEEEIAIFSEDLENQVICPLCWKGALSQQAERSFRCPNCLIILPTAPSLSHLKELIHNACSEHCLSCDNQPQFTTVCNNLFLICQICNHFSCIL